MAITPNMKSRDQAELKQQLGNTVFEGLLSGKLKPPKSVQQGELEARSKRQMGMEEALRRDFGHKAKKRKMGMPKPAAHAQRIKFF